MRKSHFGHAKIVVYIVFRISLKSAIIDLNIIPGRIAAKAVSSSDYTPGGLRMPAILLRGTKCKGITGIFQKSDFFLNLGAKM